jgi:hypothetical protein
MPCIPEICRKDKVGAAILKGYLADLNANKI